VVGVLLVAAALMPVITAFTSTIGGQVTTTQEISVVAMASVVGAVSAVYAADPTQPAYLATILVTIGATTVLCGVAMFALGAGGLGRIIRFVPYPVFGGFLAITGWYLFVGGLETVLGHRFDLDQLRLVTQDPNTGLKVGFAAVFVVVVTLVARRFGSGALLPLAMLLVAILFNAFVIGAGIPLADLQAAGWIIRVPAEGIAWPPVGVADLAAVDWHAVGQGLLFAPLVVIVVVAASMMNVSGIEIEIRGELDLNRELRSMGIGNIASGLVGGTAGFPAVSGTLISFRMGTPQRAVGVIAGMVSLVAVIFAQQLLNTVPAPLLGALLMWLGTSLLIDWVIKPLRTLRRQEHAIILLILAVSIAAGFASGILAGLVAALLLFVFEYSRVDGIRFAATGRDYQSRLLPDSHRATLERIGGSIVIMKLSGFIFFGTADRIIQRVTSRVVATAPEPVRFVIMDFRRVTGIDSSTVMSFERLKRLAEKHDVVVILAGLNRTIVERLTAGGLNLTQLPFRTEPDLDTAVSWAERRLLSEVASAPTPAHALARQLGSEALADQLRPYCDKVTFAEGSRLIEQGATADDMFFIDSGEGVVVLEAEHGEVVRLMGFSSGTILGEVAFYLGQRRSASAVATSEVTAYRLSRARLADVEREVPGLAAAFHYEIARALADRLQSANRLIQILAD
jgi:SulP family sulfate permease